MLQFKTILHPTDFSPQSDWAFQLACSLARDHGASLVVLHAMPIQPPLYGEILPPPEPAIREQLWTALRNMQPPAPGIRVTHLLEEGNDAATVILDAAQATRADLIVMGTHGRTGLLSRVLMGSVAETVVRMAPCPVLTVRAPQAQGTVS